MDVSRRSLRHGGRLRTFTVVRPGSASPGPLLVALHGTGQRGGTLRRFSGRTFDALAARVGGTVVYPDAYRRRWNDARRSLKAASRRADVDDVGFIRALTDRMRADAGVDPERVLLVGYSNGGQLVSRIVHQDPSGLAGAAMIAAARPADDDFLLLDAPAAPLPVLLLHGTEDPIAPYAGGETRILGRPQGTNLSAEATARWFAARNGIGSEPTVHDDDGVRRFDFAAEGRPPVRLVAVRGAGHVVPNRSTRPPLVGPSVRSLDTGEEIEGFFGIART